ncbi:WEB family protein At1g12150-like [Actinidia eriantha]|uniref:WEB family protein At1g12150-like n=1 Tax=Actinidia eriantha TaxID=165200 RepID=UPI00258E0C4C|nr:WEB family protein At1g12150-like [Actinidia eriantha]
MAVDGGGGGGGGFGADGGGLGRGREVREGWTGGETMGEVDTKPIESVQAALSLFGEGKYWSTGSDELGKVKELEDLLKDLANVKLQLEAKDSAYQQALLELDHYQKIANELATLLKNSEFEKDMCINECREGIIRRDELESKVKEMTDQLSENEKIGEQISLVMTELNTTQAELLSMENALSDAREARLEALTREEMRETELQMEKEKTEELLRHVSELNETILHSSVAAIEAEKVRCAILSEKEAEIEIATTKALEAEEELEFVRKELEAMKDLENQLMDKSLTIESLQGELEKTNELRCSSEKAASDAINELKQQRMDLELLEMKNIDQLGCIGLLEMELNQLKIELKNANEEMRRVSSDAESTRGELQKVKLEIDEIRARETEAQVEIAMLKSELHKGRSRVAAAEARAKNEKSGLYLAVQQLAMEAEEAKKENRRLKDEAENAGEGSESSSQDVKLPQIAESECKGEDDSKALVIIPMRESKALVERAENIHETENLKKELENASVKIGELRARAEQATSRAEVAETAKLALEDQLRKWREQRGKRRAALAALREESFPKEESRSFNYEQTPKTYQPLSKILNMKF